MQQSPPFSPQQAANAIQTRGNKRACLEVPESPALATRTEASGAPGMAPPPLGAPMPPHPEWPTSPGTAPLRRACGAWHMSYLRTGLIRGHRRKAGSS